jgi:general secretion pathway protein K
LLSSPPFRQRGFALLIVLWSMVLIGLLITQILASGRTATALAGHVRAAAVARAAADGAISDAVYHALAFGADHWAADGVAHLSGSGGLVISVRVESLAGKINPNLASTALLGGLFQAVGAAPDQAAALAGAMITWRSPAPNRQAGDAAQAAYRRAGLAFGPPGHNFADLSELSGVIGMPPALLAAAMPHLSIYQSGDPDPALADPQVREALALAGQTGSSGTAYTGAVLVVLVEAEVDGPGHLVVRREAYVSLPGANAALPFQFLAWEDE